MSDAYLNFANSAFGARLAGMLGLPRPVPLERFEAGQPVVAGDVLVGAGGTPELLPALLAGRLRTARAVRDAAGPACRPGGRQRPSWQS
jgi:3-oxoacyl-[acyl-carrier protein] reductase